MAAVTRARRTRPVTLLVAVLLVLRWTGLAQSDSSGAAEARVSVIVTIQATLPRQVEAKQVTVSIDGSTPENVQLEALSERPLAIGVVMDNSGSTSRSRFHKPIASAILSLVTQVLQAGKARAFWVNFADEFFLDQDLTTDPAGLQKAAARMEAKGGSAIFDATLAACNHFKASGAARRVLILVSDGDDNRSTRGKKQLPDEFAHSSCTVYAVSTDDPEAMRLHATRSRDGSLKLLSDETGGQFFRPRTTEELRAAVTAIAADFTDEYLLSFSAPVRDGRVHDLRVQGSDANLAVRAPRHVFLPKN